jgi:alpha-beta hydrolase superfamily lysophospholipase
MTNPLSETYFVESEDKTKLLMRHWDVESPKAVMALVHGLGEHSGRYDSLAPDLVAEGIAVIALDLRGHGQSEGKRGVSTEYARLHEDVDALLAEVQTHYPDRAIILYGHSLGGGLVMDYALKSSPAVKAMIASAPFIGLPKTPPAIIGIIAKAIRKISNQATMKQPLTGEKISSIPAEQSRYESDLLNHGQISFGLAVDAVEAGERVEAGAAQWFLPLLLMHARGDQLTAFEKSEAFATRAANVTFKAYDNSEHEMHHDVVRQDVVSEMLTFIKANI